MAGIRREDVRMKMPAILHLTRLGYGYLSPKGFHRDPRTHIHPASLRTAIRRIYRGVLTGDQFDRLMEDLREQLNRPDLGEAFYRTIRDGWNGIPLIDFDCPENNEFLVVPELDCRAGKSFFRPDLTLMVNGLPLAMIEVKTETQEKGIRAEYDRMGERLRNPEFRRFLQCVQVWAFSNNRESDAGRFLPTEGPCFAAAVQEDFPLRVFPEKAPGENRRLQRADPAVIQRIRGDLGLSEAVSGREVRRAMSPHTPTHRMLTALFAPERFLFLIRYGVRYGLVPDREGNPAPRKNLVTAEQFFTLLEAERKIRRGFRNWSLTSRGASGEAALIASLITMLQEKIPEARVYWVAADRADLRRTDAEMRAWGTETARRGRPEKGKPLLTEPAEDPRAWRKEPGERDFGGTRILLIPSPFPGTERMIRFRKGVRREDPLAVMISLTRSAEPARQGNYTYLLACADGTLYCGWTTDLAQRVRAHNGGRGAKYTRGRGPVKLVYWERFDTREEAMSREWYLKRMSRAEKEKLIAAWAGPEEDRSGNRPEDPDAGKRPEKGFPGAGIRKEGKEKA